ncbi:MULTISPECIES: excinuclease ABC subunit UvrA [Culturomica]|jgi:excinuclease ABC subunit A|uniref:excinuclease ABC subunit UvrA n=1 Tax=Culturomica TaxID=1926651 RepID=UPI00033D5C40|nr:MULTISPECIES: excinuclease ABC subunit UvrA [Odoribacteraceae]RHV98647.1 excinuclease ABC subunit UvrA [Odoribacter sp. OF09-27XD]CCZ06662.1 excinuclease ABC subunit A [Odoribacter sp. CAG:788]HBO25846.1 excinuclease ABC subunit UvrA [Culturomica sp.]
MEEDEVIKIYGAREHNLKNVDLTIPRNRLTVITGLSGSGKSSLAFDTIYAEGQRRYMETFSAYARQFLGGMERPDVDKITGLSPVISIEQKTTNKNPRSTVGTTTEVYDFLRLLFARAGEAYSYVTGKRMVKYTDEQIIDLIQKDFAGKKIMLLAPVVKGRKGHYKDLFESLQKKGFLSARIDGEIREIVPGMAVDRYKIHDIEIVVDKLVVDDVDEKRLKGSVATAMKHGDGVMMVQEYGGNELKYYSRHLMCPDTGISYKEPAPHSFSFNSPHGACPKCKGLGYVTAVDMNKIVPDDSLSIYDGGILPLGKYKNGILFWQIDTVLKKHGTTLHTAIRDLPEEALTDVLYGYPGQLRLENKELGVSSNSLYTFEGIIKYITMQEENATSKKANKWAEQFVSVVKCDVCDGQRLNRESLHFRIAGKNISELAQMELTDLYEWVCRTEQELGEKQKQIAGEIFKEIRTRLKFLLDVGLEYLSLDRQSMTLSGGESQRIRLATQIGSQLVNVLYILDEPSIGLHQKDNRKLIHSLQQLRDAGNSVIVVEHDKEMMEKADYIVDMGPKAGRKGGEVMAVGTIDDIRRSDSLTAQYLNGVKAIRVPEERRKGNGKYLKLSGCTGNNLKNVDVEIPLGMLVGVTGVSGSGKSSLINGTLRPILSEKFYRAIETPLPYRSIEGIEHVDKVVVVDQSPLGRTPRSNPATYTGIFADIRKIFEKLPESQIRGYAAGRFSFNMAGGRCEECKGAGVKTIEMNFLPDVYVHCESCDGKRYNKETLEIRYKGKSIGDVLNMTINQAVEFFENVSYLQQKLKVLQEVGLGYIKLGQQCTTLSGGESQRIKLATELSKKDTGKTLYILDEPTTGLHFEDINILLEVIQRLVNKGNSVIVIEHNLDVIKVADYLIDMGPGGGKDGGKIIATGTPEDVARVKISETGKFLKEELGECL